MAAEWRRCRFSKLDTAGSVRGERAALRGGGGGIDPPWRSPPKDLDETGCVASGWSKSGSSRSDISISS
eukprot:5504635-Prymnesium_polylepis.1